MRPHRGADPGPNVTASRRNHQMDLMRIVFASLVLLAHAPEIADGNESRELLFRFTHALSFGSLAVDGFFLLSGFLIVRSWTTSATFWEYLRRRVLRIVPGYAVAALLSIALLGTVASSAPNFFKGLDRASAKSILYLSSPITPPVFPGLPYPFVNQPLWTISYEFRCYLLVPLLAFCGFLRRPFAWLALTVALLCLSAAQSLHRLPEWHSHLLEIGIPDHIYRLVAAFLVGGCFYLFRDYVKYRWFLSLIAATTILLATRVPPLFESVLIVSGGYLLFHLASLKLTSLTKFDRVPDVSYGMYLYGWPVECLLIWCFPGHPWLVFGAALLCCLCLGWLSWHFVERPALRFKTRSSSASLGGTQVPAA